MDYQSLLYNPNYLIFGVEGTLTLPGTDGDVIVLAAIDKTSGVEVGGSADVQTILPAAVVRASELSSISLTDLEDATLVLNSKTWVVKSHMLKPSPKGEADGEVYLILYEGG
jgi:hypothetical protein